MTQPTQLIRRPVFEIERTAKIDLQKPLWSEIKKVYAGQATEPEFLILARVIEATNLDIFNREIFWIPKIGTYISHKGYWALAMRSEVWDGFEPHQFYYKDKDGNINQERKGELYSVKATGWRKDMRFPVIFEALWDEWEKVKSYDGKVNPNWDGRPEHMLTVKAERGVLFRAFPISGAMEAYQVDEDTIPTIAVKAETVSVIKALPTAVSAGSVEGEEAVVLPPTPPSPEKPALLFNIPARAKAEVSNLINKILELRIPEMTPAKLFNLAFASSTATSETLSQCEDLELLNKAYLRLKGISEN